MQTTPCQLATGRKMGQSLRLPCLCGLRKSSHATRLQHRHGPVAADLDAVSIARAAPGSTPPHAEGPAGMFPRALLRVRQVVT